MENKSTHLLADMRLVQYLKIPFDPVQFIGAGRCVFTVLFTVFTLWSCATFRYPPGPALDPAPYPKYTVGTTFVYSDGTRETVTKISPTIVTWRDGEGNRFKRSADFIYNPVEWETGRRHGTRRFSLRNQETLWPLQKGKSIRYVEDGNWVDETGSERSYQALWTCEVMGTESVSVLAGNFDAWKIVCKRYSVAATSNRSRKIEEKAWYYAPQIGHYVLTTRRFYDTRKPRRRELAAVLPPLDGLSTGQRRQLNISFQNAMEYAQSGESIYWHSAEGKLSGEITPVDTFRMPGRAFCRQYAQKLYLPDSQRSYYGIVCRDPQGRWITP